MDEGTLLLIWTVKALVVVLCAVLYRLGGWKNKVFRRYVMPVVYMGACVGMVYWENLVMNWWMMLSLPMLIGTLCMGYSNKDGNGWKKRLIIAGLLSLTFLNFLFIFGRWELYVAHCVLCFLGMAFFGITNPFDQAVAEEATIATMALMMPIFMI